MAKQKYWAITITLCLSACATTIETQPVSQALAPTLMPEYSVGYQETWADYDSGENQAIHTVVAVSEQSIDWKTDQGESWSNQRKNSFMPGLAWNIKQFGQGTQEILSSKGELFPLRVGNTMQQSYTGSSSRYPEGWRDTQRCSVESEERVSVLAGTFDTFKIACENGSFKRLFYYAPELSTHIVFIRNHKKGRYKALKRQLVAVKTP